MFRSTGTVTTNGWTFHGTPPENVKQLDQADTTVSTRSETRETRASTLVGQPAVRYYLCTTS